MAEVPLMPVPMWLISGVYDLNTPKELTSELFDQGDAPHGKHHVFLEDFGHASFLIEPDRCTAMLAKVAESIRSE